MRTKAPSRTVYSAAAIFGGAVLLHRIYVGGSLWNVAAIAVWPLTAAWGVAHGVFWLCARSDRQFALRFDAAFIMQEADKARRDGDMAELNRLVSRAAELRDATAQRELVRLTMMQIDAATQLQTPTSATADAILEALNGCILRTLGPGALQGELGRAEHKTARDIDLAPILYMRSLWSLVEDSRYPPESEVSFEAEEAEADWQRRLQGLIRAFGSRTRPHAYPDGLARRVRLAKASCFWRSASELGLPAATARLNALSHGEKVADRIEHARHMWRIKRQQELEKAQRAEQYAQQQAAYEASERALRSTAAKADRAWRNGVRSRYGEAADAIIRARQTRRPEIGFSERALLEALGEPERRLRSVMKTKTREWFYYEPAQNKSGSTEFGLEIVLENGAVTEWSEGIFRPRN